MDTHARVVVIGGGITGCAILYHLAKKGWKDVVLLERSELTSGSTWHAAGNLFSLTRPSNAQRLQVYTINLYPEIERESGQAVGYHPTGGMHLAASNDEVTTLAIARARARRNGVEAEWISFEEARERAPVLDTRSLKAVLWEPIKGHVDPSSATNAFAAAARKLGAKIHRHTPVTATTPRADGGWDVETPGGTIHAEFVVNAAGLWAREVGALAGIKLPLLPVEHHYLVTEAIPEIEAMDHELPTIGESEAGYYSRQEGKGILLGAYESTCHHWAFDGTPLDFGHELLPNDLARMDRNFEVAMDRMPCLGEAGIKRVINGPMIFSPDLGPLLGPHPELKNYFCACGVMSGLNQGAGIGKVISEWIVDGEPEMDVNFWDVARFGRWAGKRFTFERTRYYYENRQERPYPHLECAAGRPLRTFPAYAAQKAKGAVFGFSNGWEQPLWFARPGDEQRDIFGYARQNWWKTVGEECKAVRSAAGLFEISTFAKYRISGDAASGWLKWVLAGRIPERSGAVSLSPMLSEKGRLIGDLTVSRLDDGSYLLLGAGTMQGQHMRWFDAHKTPGITVENLSDSWSGLMLAGPNARKILASVTYGDVSGEAFPFLSVRRMEIEGATDAIVLRVSFSGELGYEIYTPAMYQAGLYDALLRAGADLGLVPAGSRALASLRVEKAFKSWGLDLAPDYTVMETGMDRFVDWKRSGFIGEQAAREHSAQGATERFVTLAVDADDADCSGGEPVFLDDVYVGYVTSGAYGYAVNQSLALGYLKSHVAETGSGFEVEINGKRRAASISDGPRYDPQGLRMRM
ncbi:FAD-dependent oxidoreductase [Mesorhizobium sp. PAMC28654]|uniref:GcvT family protein n=1 Tax=Mesorhizobium sp. PAMC28654 TaxID=2880934 RepID=UPI001D0A90F2|nr:FAD-dependent oxidoreductase [Mesorhizobium sp. PAMC28654]UDL91314.1 FAD-dependent oxidoreductase [Mesorhizobium sp. PAMC28654]